MDRMRSPAAWPMDRRVMRISAGSLSDLVRGVRCRGERRPEGGRRDKEW
jgi:hypothetical protein